MSDDSVPKMEEDCEKSDLEVNNNQPTEVEDKIVDSDGSNDEFSDCNVDFVNIDGVTCTESSDNIKTVTSDEPDVVTKLLSETNDIAEARLYAKRQARAEAREIRMRELERQQKEQEENADRQFDMLAEPMARMARPVAGNRYLSSRRSSEDSLEDGGSLREIRHELKEVEEKFRKAMIANAQLDNDKTAQTYQLELLKDRLEELEEEHSQLKREHRDKCREHEQLKRLCGKLKDDLAIYRAELEERDRLIEEKGLVIVGEEVPPDDEGNILPPRKVLVTAENAQLLKEAGDGSLDVRLEKFAKEKSELQDQISHLKLELEEERSKRRKSSAGGSLNGPLSDYDADDLQNNIRLSHDRFASWWIDRELTWWGKIQGLNNVSESADNIKRLFSEFVLQKGEASKQLADWKFRAQKAEQDVATMQATVARLESQVIRYKTAAEISEQSEEALKSEKRKLQREDTDSDVSDDFDKSDSNQITDSQITNSESDLDIFDST